MLRVRNCTRALRPAVLLIAGLVAAGSALAQDATHEGGAPPLQVFPIRSDYFKIYVIAGAGQNVILQTGADGSVLVNTGSAQAADQLLSTVKGLTDQPIRYALNTSVDADVVGGNGAVMKAGRGIYYTGPNPMVVQGNAIPGPTILAAGNTLLRMASPTGQSSPYPTTDWPTQEISGGRYFVYFNHEGIEFYPQAAADNSDAIVYFRGSDVIAAGNIIDADRFPVIDVQHGGSIQGEVTALNRIIQLSVIPMPFIWLEGEGTYIVPSRGRLYQQYDVVEYRNMMVEIQSIVQDMINRKMSLQQIQAAQPALPYAVEYGRDSGPWTTNDFVKAVYDSLTQVKQPKAKAARSQGEG